MSADDDDDDDDDQNMTIAVHSLLIQKLTTFMIQEYWRATLSQSFRRRNG